MAIIRKVFGPTRMAADTGKLRWLFSGVKEDGTEGHWVLTYTAHNRRFYAGPVRTYDLKQKARALMGVGALKLNADEPDEGPFQGKITDILKSKLRPEDIAKATAMAITRR